MTVVVLGLDALDPELVDEDAHPHLVLAAHRPIETIVSRTGSPSTHELWPSIITGLPPEEHGLLLEDGVAWESAWLRVGSRLADALLPDGVQTSIGAWLLTNTDQDAFRTPASYYRDRGIETLFDEPASLPIGVPNYVVDSDAEDREHRLRRTMGELFARDPESVGGHVSADPGKLYERCLEMSMIRIARVRRALRGRSYELVFGYTSGLDLIGHIAHDDPEMQARAYDELDDFVGELRADLGPDDVLLLLSDHGLQNGLHTDTAMVSGTSSRLVEDITSVLDVKEALQAELSRGEHEANRVWNSSPVRTDEDVRDHLEDLGYI